MMILVAPSAWMRSCASRLEPSPTASIEMTAATPKTIPSTVSPERSLCRSRLFIPSFNARQMRPMEALPPRRIKNRDLPSLPDRGPHSSPEAPTVSDSFLLVAADECGLVFQGLHPRARLVLDDQPVPHADDPLGVTGVVVFVSDHDDGLAGV